MVQLFDSYFYAQLTGFIISLFCAALFSFFETSITALRLFKIKEIEEKNSRYASFLQTLEKHPHRILVSILIANSLADTTSAALATSIMEDLFHKLQFSSSLGFSLGIGIATASILIFGEIIPKNLAKSHGERLLPSLLWLISGIFYLLYPFVSILMKLSQLFINWFAGKKGTEGTESVTSEKEIKFLIDYIDERGLMESEKTEMLQSIFSLSQTPVKEIMVPAIDMVSINIDASLQDALDIFSRYHFSRLPVYENKQDNITGMIYLKDVFFLLSQKQEKPLKELVRTVIFIPESVKVNQLLSQLKQTRVHIALVVNEFGGVVGLVTLEDVLEEIVGEISDEYETIAQRIIPLKQGGWLVDASINLQELSEILGITFETETAITPAGFLTEQLNRLPRKGERYVYKNYCFQVQHASMKKVYEILIFEESKVKDMVPIDK